MQFRMLGGLEVTRDGRPVELGGPKQRAVLAALLLDLGRPVPASRLEDHVWGDDPPANPETSLQAYISNLRRALEPERKPRQPARLLVTHPAGYALLADRAAVDATRFEDLARDGAAALARGDGATAVATLDAALGLWAGPPLPELAGERLADDAAARLGAVRTSVLELRFEAGLALGERDGLVDRLEQAVAEHPFRERLWGQLALALYRSGRQREALAALARARTTLIEEVGIEPGPELRRLESDILAQAPELDPAPAMPAASRAAPPAAPSPAPPVAPAPQTNALPFVGRDADLEVLLAAAAGAASGVGRPVVISGEPGIGKTRLVEELVARLPGAAVAWGRSPESAAGAAYWPCIQIARQLEGADALDPDVVLRVMPSGPSDFAEIPTAERFGLHTAIVEVLATARRPLVLVVDDLQWADPATLRMVEFVATELRRTRVLLVATVRPVGPDAPVALIDCLGELARQTGAVRIELGGLSGADIGEWLEARRGSPVDARVADLVRDRTDGNPFFVGEVLALLAGEGRLADDDVVRRGVGVPAAVQDVVRRRVSRLPAETQQLLSAASVVGRSFDLDVLGAVIDAATVDLLDLIDPALAAGLVRESDLPGRFEFAHALVGETLEAEVSTGRRSRLHARALAALEQLRGSDLEGHVAELAHHAVEGVAAGTAEAAYSWSVRAAEQATSRLAHEDAAEHWGRALRAVELARPRDAIARFGALLAQGKAWLRVDDVASGYRSLAAAIDLAIAIGEPALAGEAAAAMSIDGLWQAGEIGLTSVDAIGALERALEILPPDPTPARSLAMGTLAENAYWHWPVDRLDAVSAEAVAVARATGDASVLGRTLHKRHQALWRPAMLGPAQAAAFELLELVERKPVPAELEAVARFGAAGVHWELAQLAEVWPLVDRASTLTDELGSPALRTQLDYFIGTLHGFAGRLAEAERFCDRAHELYRRTRRWIAEPIYVGTRLPLLLEQGRTAEIDATAHHLLEGEYRPWFQEAYALALVRQGRLDEAAALVDGQLPPLVDCWLYLGVVAAAAEVRAAIGDVAAATELAGHLAPFAGRLASAGTGPAFSDVHYVLGRAARVAGDDDGARHHARASVQLLRDAGASSLLARALLLRAEVDLATADADRAAAAAIVRRDGLELLRAELASV